ncbi:FtsB family cell division protein [Aquabacter spiritensis]|uniref:Cell division protein FtsB n=1 Tax=Aquabacter spiritensis TaxID=933073 RepID=A0A4R3LXU5_9HYPH|nr:septum formation initiator family protein [Aquabacter spiritensis]TCT03555.1 cell division protein FtsB [Aquabacter spiritensis]
MQTRSRLRSILSALTLYAVAAGVIGYFAHHAYSGDHGLRAKRSFLQEMAELEAELAKLRAVRTAIEHKVSLLDARRLDPDLLDEEGRRQLDFVHAKDLVLLKPAQ